MIPQDSSLTDLVKKYHLTLESIALQTRHILETLNAAGHNITVIHASGGLTRNRVLIRLIADVCGVGVVLPGEGEGAMVRGAAMLGRLASEAEGMNEKDASELLWTIMVSGSVP